MSTVKGCFGQVQNSALAGGTMPLFHGASLVGLDDLTSSGSAQTMQRGGSNWAAPGDGYVMISSDGAVRVRVSDIAAAGEGYPISAGGDVFLSVSAGDVISVIDG